MTVESVGVRELKNGATRIIRSIREDGVEYVVTVHGEPTAVIRPFTAEDAERLRKAALEAHLAEVEALADEIGRAWSSPLTGVEAVQDQRRG